MTNLITNISSAISAMRSTMEQAQATLDKLHALSAELDKKIDALIDERDRCENDLTIPVEEFEEANARVNEAFENLRYIEMEQKIFQDYIDSTDRIIWRYNNLWGL